MKKLKIFILIGIMIIGLLLLTGCMEADQNYIEEQKRLQEEQERIQEECQHDWTITSEYSFWTDSYRTISKCSKCGKVIK